MLTTLLCVALFVWIGNSCEFAATKYEELRKAGVPATAALFQAIAYGLIITIINAVKGIRLAWVVWS